MDALMTDLRKGSRIQDVLLKSGFSVNALRANATTLLKDEWKELEDAVRPIAVRRMPFVDMLIRRGLVHNIGNGLGTTVLESQKESDLEDAVMNMHAETKGPQDRLEFDIEYLPLPITHSDFRISIRTLESSRRNGQPLDTRTAKSAMRKVAEKIEATALIGCGTYTFGGGSLQGCANFTHRNTGSLHDAWDDSSGAGAGILDDVIAMKSASIADRHFGPWALCVPTLYDAVLDDDFKANSDLTIRQRIAQVDGIEEILVCDFLTADNVLLVELSEETMRIVIGLQPTMVEWQTEGGMISQYKTMAIMVPQPMADKDNKCGIIHYTGS